MSRNTRTFEFKLGKRGLILFVFGMSLLFFFVYVFGVMVGKNIDTCQENFFWGIPIPDMVRKRMTAPSHKTETAVAAREGKGGKSTKGDDDFDLTFYDTLAKKEDERKTLITPPQEVEQEKDEKLPPTTIAEHAKEKPSPVIAQPSAAGNSHLADKHTRKETSPVKEKYLIQMVSYREKEKAENLFKRLKSLGYHPVVVTIELPERGRWFRVVLDGFATREKAQEVVNIVSKEINGLTCVIRSAEGSRDSEIRNN
ncbi:MAG: SPOR domain-containing protein [Syntrophales bacterium]